MKMFIKSKLFKLRTGTVSSPLSQTVTYDGHIQYLEHVVIKMTIEVMGDEDERKRGDIFLI